MSRGQISVGGLLAVQVVLLGWSAFVHSPTFSEAPHLPAGISHWRLGSFALYRVNPPLPRMVAAAAVLLTRDVKTAWSRYDDALPARSERVVAVDFAKANRGDVGNLYMIGRIACFPFCTLGGWVCFRWAQELYGFCGGLVSLIAWVFCPFVLGHGSLLMPDVPAASMAVLAAYCFRKWHSAPTWQGAMLMGISAGVGAVTKFTLVVMPPVLALLWLVSLRYGNARRRHPIRVSLMLLLATVTGAVAINATYGFDKTCMRLREMSFMSEELSGSLGSDARSSNFGNRFADSVLGGVPVPFPKEFIAGIDRQLADFDRRSGCYLDGAWQEGGWSYFYLYALVIKLPLGTLVLMALSATASVRVWTRSRSWEMLCLLGPPSAIIALVSSETAFSIHSRYVLPALPFLYIAAGGAARLCETARFVGRLVPICLSAAVASSLWTFPHSISYFNETVGGPRSGHEHLIDSNCAWGQDVPYVKSWCSSHPDAKPVYCAYFGLLDPVIQGLSYQAPPVRGVEGLHQENAQPGSRKIGPGWYVIDVNFLHHPFLRFPKGNGDWTSPSATKGEDLRYFREMSPVDRICYSYLVYHVVSHESGTARSQPADKKR